jgi:hypothetical protein
MSARIRDPLLRTALQLRRQLDRLAGQGADPVAGQRVDNVGESHSAVQRAWRCIVRARSRGWQLAARKLHEELRFHARRLQSGVEELLRCQDRPEPPAPPSVSFLWEELRQLREEFEDVGVQRKHGRVVATTRPIVLEGIHLGRFAIELHLGRMGSHADSSCFDCVALEPNPAETNHDVTHPHVSGKGLCAGDASTAIAAAVEQGRICDAFALVSAVLGTYNPGSPYVRLDEWAGAACPDCGCRAGRDGMYFCDGCDRETCSDCMGCCDVCEHSYCQACLEWDRVSRRDCCQSCRELCGGCDRTVDCESFDEKTALCPQCLEERVQEPGEQEDDQDGPDETTITTTREDEPHEQQREQRTEGAGAAGAGPAGRTGPAEAAAAA